MNKDENISVEFIEHAVKWFDTLSDEDADKLVSGITVSALLVLFKHFPSNQLIGALLQSKL